MGLQESGDVVFLMKMHVVPGFLGHGSWGSGWNGEKFGMLKGEYLGNRIDQLRLLRTKPAFQVFAGDIRKRSKLKLNTHL